MCSPFVPAASRDECGASHGDGRGCGVRLEQALLDVVQQFVDGGVHEEQLVEDLDQIRALFGEAQEEWVLNVMDRLVGWCAPDARIGRSGADD